MSDRMDAVLASIDGALSECICGQPIPENGPSLDYCSDVCQYRYTAQQAGTEPDAELMYPIPPAETDGRAINEEVNEWITDTTTATGYDEEPFEYPPDSLGADLQRLSIATREMAQAFAEPFRQFTTALTAGLDRAENMRTLEVVVPDLEERSAYLYVCDNSPGIALEYAQAGIPVELVKDLRESGMTTMQFVLTLNTPEPSTPEEFRRRALEHHQNRGTGPARRDNRRWRNT